MLYLGTSPSEPAVVDLLDRRRIGLMCQPGSNHPRPGWLWAADNGCFGAAAWNAGRWQRWLVDDHPRAGCLFAVVPDVVGDARGTLRRFDEYVDAPRRARYPIALAAQDGLEELTVPWARFDCLFIGGSTAWKMSEPARSLAAEAHALGKWVHVGRVNSAKRFRVWAAAADSCDGTFLAFGPAVNVPQLLQWIEDYDRSPQFALPPGGSR